MEFYRYYTDYQTVYGGLILVACVHTNFSIWLGVFLVVEKIYFFFVKIFHRATYKSLVESALITG